MNLFRILKQLLVFIVVFVLVGAFVGNPLIVSAYRSSSVVSAASSSSTGSLSNSSSSSSQQFSTVPTSIPGILSEAKLLGPLSSDDQLSLQLVLPLRDSAGLQSFLGQLYNPASAFYHRFLTASQFYALYGPDQTEVTALTAYMRSKGVQIQISATNPNVAEARGTVSQIQNALKTQIDSFSWNGQVFYSATSEAQLPSRFSNIQMIYGLEDFDSQLGCTVAVPLYRTLGTITPDQTSSSFPLYYSPSEIRQMYNATSLLNDGYTGTGVSIAIVDAYGDPYIQQELQNFSAQFGLPYYNGTLHIIPVGPYNPEEGILTGWNMEIALDVEWAHAMAPNATINLYIASNDTSILFDAVLNATLGFNGTAYGVYKNSIISMSWAEPENDFGSSTPVDPVFGLNYPWLDQVFQMDSALGITVFASSGDWGAYDQTHGQTSPYGGASYPSTDQYVTGVGGTSLYMNTTSGYYQWPYANATGTYGNETAWSWNNYYGWGTGGGWSTLFGQPSWQTGPGVVNNGERGDPDVAWDADPQTGVLVSVFNSATDSYDYYIVGGTSVGSPSWAGSMALIDQKAGGSLGFINPAIYSILNNSTEYSKAFHDVTVGNNDPYGATTGWDPLTGVGSPNLGELANYLAPTGQLPVIVTNDFSSTLGQAYAYGEVVNLTAVVANNGTISGPVTATITSSAGTTVASIALTYNALAGAWLGSYVIKATDPSGEWSVTVTATNGSSSGEGYTTFAVGDGVTIVNPPYYTGQFYQVGDTIHVDSYAVNTSGSYVTKGAYTATFYLAQNQTTGNRLGRVEGKVALQYNSSDSLWEGNLSVPKGADQGAWIMVVNGTDMSGNKGSAYIWINVGLDIFPFTDSPTYVLGDKILIFAYPSYANGYEEVETGAFTAVIYDGSVFVAKVPLTFSDILWLWTGVFTVSARDPTGFYAVTVNGTDGKGNSGAFTTVVRVAQYSLTIQASVSNPVLPVQNGNESWVLAKVTYPDGSPMTVGSVIGFVYLNLGGGVTSSAIGWFPMTYNSTAGGFVAVNLFHAINATETPIGNYTVDVEAYDASGNYGNVTTSFFVAATNHAAIDITSDAYFNAANGVIGGNGTLENPYLIAGWNVSSISISNVTLSYALLNDYVSGSTGNGITIDTPNSEPTVDYVYTVRNGGYGLYANNSPAGFYYEVIAGNNGKDGILIANDTQAENGVVESSVAYNNELNGIVYEASSQPNFYLNVAVGNAQVGLLSQDSNSTSFMLNSVSDSAVGINVTAKAGSWYNRSIIEENEVQNNGIGIYVDGLGQNSTTASVFGSPSYTVIYDNEVVGNNIGIYAANQAVIDAEDNLAYENNIGISTMDSLAYLVGNFVQGNSGNGIQIVGQSAFEVEFEYEGVEVVIFRTVVRGNIAVLNGNSTMISGSGISVSNTNSSFVVENYVALNGGDGIELSNVTGGSLQSPTTSVLGNEALSNSYGVYFYNCSSNIISNNSVTGNGYDGMNLYYCSNNNISTNNMANNEVGILLDSSSSNTVSGNNITNNGYGIYLSVPSKGNMIYHNNFIDNNQQVYSNMSMNVWDAGYPSGGNYWSDYRVRYPNAAEVDSSGIWNTPYVIDANNTDRYPLMGPFFSVSVSPYSVVLDVGQSQLFTSTVSGGTSPYSYQWYLNGAAEGTSSTWTFTPSSSGSYTVYCNVTDNVGIRVKSDVVTVTVNSALSVSISPTSVTIDVGQSVTFASAVSGGTSSYSYQWYVNGVAVTGATSATWTYTLTSASSYTVYLKVTDSAFPTANTVTSNTATISVSGSLSVTVSPGLATLDVGQSQTFNSTVSSGTSPYSYQWYLNGLAVAGANGPSWTYKFTSSGAYTVYLKVTDTVGASAISNATLVTVNVALSVTVSPGLATLDVGQFQTFNSTVSSGTSPYIYQWYLNGTLISGATGSTWTFTPASAGSYAVYANVTDNVGVTAKSNIAPVTVNPALSVSISPASVTLDVGQSQLFSSTTSGGTSPYAYQWYLNGAPVSGATSAGYTFAPSSAGVYNVSLVVQDAANYQLTVSPTKITINNSTLITNFSVTPLSSSMLYSNNEASASLSASAGSSPYTYEWYLNGVNVGNTTSPSYTYVFSKMGQQQMQVKVTDSVGYVVESSVLSTNYSYNYVPFVLLAVVIVAVIGGVIFVHRRRVSKPSTPKT